MDASNRQHPFAARRRASGDVQYGISQEDMVQTGDGDDGLIDGLVNAATGGGSSGGGGIGDAVDRQVERVRGAVREDARTIADAALDRQRLALEASARAAAQRAGLALAGVLLVFGVGYLVTRD